MSREPQSAAHRYTQAGGRRLIEPEPPPEPARPSLHKRAQERGILKNMRPLPAPAKPEPAKPARDPYKTRWKDLTPEEMASFVIYPKDKP